MWTTLFVFLNFILINAVDGDLSSFKLKCLLTTDFMLYHKFVKLFSVPFEIPDLFRPRRVHIESSLQGHMFQNFNFISIMS